jgi:hypothetical protein
VSKEAKTLYLDEGTIVQIQELGEQLGMVRAGRTHESAVVQKAVADLVTTTREVERRREQVMIARLDGRGARSYILAAMLMAGGDRERARESLGLRPDEWEAILTAEKRLHAELARRWPPM